MDDQSLTVRRTGYVSFDVYAINSDAPAQTKTGSFGE